jgi:hypothetical protein
MNQGGDEKKTAYIEPRFSVHFIPIFPDVSMPVKPNFKVLSLLQFMDIPLSSPLGSRIIRSSGLGLDQQNPALRSVILSTFLPKSDSVNFGGIFDVLFSVNVRYFSDNTKKPRAPLPLLSCS